MIRKIVFSLVCFLSFITLKCEAQQTKLIIPSGHIYSASEAFFSAEDKYIITRAENVKIWEAATGKLIKNIDFSKSPKDVYLYKNNEILAIAYDDSIRFWNIQQDRQIAAIKGNNFSVNEKLNTLIIMYYNDNDMADAQKARLYNATTLAFEHQFEDYVAAAGDGKQFANVDLNKVSILDSAFNKTFSKNEGNVAGISTDFKYVAIIGDTILNIWGTKQKKVLHTMPVRITDNYSVKFVPGKNLMLLKITKHDADKSGYTMQSDDSYIRGFDLTTFKEIYKYPEQNGNIEDLLVNNETITVASNDSTIRQWDAKTGRLLSQVKDALGKSNHIALSKSGKYVIATSSQVSAKIWDMQAKRLHLQLEESNSYIDGLKFAGSGDFAFFTRENDVWLWDIKKGRPKFTIPGKAGRRTYHSAVSDDGNMLFVITTDETKINFVKGGGFSMDFKMPGCKLEVYDVNKNMQVAEYPLADDFWRFAVRPDGKMITLAFRDSTIQHIDIETGVKSKSVKNKYSPYYIEYLPDNQHMVFIADNYFAIYDYNNKLVSEAQQARSITSYNYDPQSGIIALVLSDRTIRIGNIKNGSLLYDVPNFRNNENRAFSRETMPVVFDRNMNYVCMAGVTDSMVVIIDLKTGDLSKSVKLPAYSADISFNSKNNLLMRVTGGIMYEWDIAGQKLIDQSKYLTEYIEDIQPAGQYLLGHTAAEVYVLDKRYREPMYTISVLPGTDYITYDLDKRFDGSENARKRLYFSCGTEIIELDQVKDQLWVPGLAGRVMADDKINAPKITDLDICGLTPQVDELEQQGGYRFRITPRRGGLGETALYLNGIELRRYTTQQLKKISEGYELQITDNELQAYMKSGQDNVIELKAYTIKNDISSRGASVTSTAKPVEQERPNLFAVMIGISDYKGDELDLKYAAKDATDMSKAVAISARKLLNTDGKEHVFMYNLTTDSSRYMLPEKNAIQQTLQAIGQKARPNDILLIFFAGHGVTKGEHKQFYLLSADASAATATGAPAGVGISMAELTDWIQPAKLKAQKRVLILDACNSGQAINDLVQIGAGQQNYLAARSNDNAEQIKAIDKLNERSGLFILAASASDQRAYEMSRYSQGLLTYALLRSVKEQPDILEQGKYLDVGRWFGAAEKAVTDLVRETGNRQQPQVVSTTNFNIGMVDAEVMAAIKLPQEKALFTASNFINPAAGDDDLAITPMINTQLGEISTRGEGGNITYMMTNSADAYMLTGIYTITGNDVLMKINLKKGNGIKTRFEVKGNKADLNNMAVTAIKMSTDWIDKNK